MTDEQIGTTVTEDVEKAEADADMVLDHASALATTVQAEIVRGQEGLAVLKTHSAAGAIGSTVQLAIDHFSALITSLAEAVGLYHANSAVAVPAEPIAQTVFEPAPPASEPVSEAPAATAELEDTAAVAEPEVPVAVAVPESHS